jgi:hypothetical protein
MSESVNVDSFKHDNRKYKINWNKPNSEVEESYQLNEEIKLIREKREYFNTPEEPYLKVVPLVIAFRNKENKIAISMQHEGLPIEPLLHFLNSIKTKWEEKSEK